MPGAVRAGDVHVVGASERRYLSLPALCQPIVTKALQTRKRLAVFHTICSRLAPDDVVGMTDHEPLDVYSTTPRIVETLDAVRSKDQIEIERAILELHEVFATLHVVGLGGSELEAELQQRLDQRSTVAFGLLDEYVGVLGRVRKTAPLRAKASRISSAWAYSNRAAIAQPVGKVCLAPRSILGHGCERPIRRVVEHRFVRVDEGVAKAGPKRSSRGRLELGLPLPKFFGSGVAWYGGPFARHELSLDRPRQPVDPRHPRLRSGRNDCCRVRLQSLALLRPSRRGWRCGASPRSSD